MAEAEQKPLTAEDGSNRTFMELKYGDLRPKGKVAVVLIVPLWN